jgi:hypothetical protein
MRNKIIAVMAAAVATGSMLIAPTTADAHYYHHRHHHRGGAAIAGFAAGAILGGALASRPYGYAYAPGPVYGGSDAVRYCMSRFKSYDPGSGTYLGYDGYRHPCP